MNLLHGNHNYASRRDGPSIVGRKRVAIIHAELQRGGAGFVALWAIEALKEDYDVTLITASDFDVAHLNDFYRTTLANGDFSIIQVPVLGVFKNPLRFWLLKHHLTMRLCKSLRQKLDLFFGTSNEMDFGIQGIQYIHFPVLAEEGLCKLGIWDAGKWYYQASPLRSVYKKFCESISGFDRASMKRNITLVNSNWTGDVVRQVYGIESRTVYPPVPADFPDVPWSQKEEGFVCIGRISPEKKIETIIEILSEVKKRGRNIHLHIIGTPGANKQYNEKIKAKRKENAEWIFWEQSLPRQELVDLVSKHKYGIHGMQNEHFGIAVAEMTKAGCIVFVPTGGGQAEIVSNPRLIYNSTEDAVAKISFVLSHSDAQFDLCQELCQNAEQFSVTNFMNNIRQVVGQFFEE